MYRWIGFGLLLLLLTLSLQAEPAFEVATVKLSTPPQGDLFNINLGRIQNGRVTLSNASLSDCIKFAWGIVSNEQLNGPDWIKSSTVRFDIVAQTAPDTPDEQIRVMLQTLLADRLKLALHHEQKEMAYLALVLAKGGPKMAPAKTGAAANGFASGGHIATARMTMPRLATLISRFERNIVIDQTGLKGPFEIKLDWAVQSRTPADAPAGASIFTAVQEQLGLRLESRKGPLDVLVVDRADKVPADN